MPSIKGTASVPDARARSKALKATRFPKNFSQPVDVEKINKPVLIQWIEKKVTEILGFDDEIVSSTAINLFLPSEGASPDPRKGQLDLVGFLGETESASFARDLWDLMLDAQTSNAGIPRVLLEEKKKELSQKAAMQPNPLQQQSNNHSSQNRYSHQNNRNPEMNRFVQEAARRAHAARQMVGADDGLPGPVMQNDAPVPIPVSPPHQYEHGRGRAPYRSEIEDDDRKMPPGERYGRNGRSPRRGGDPYRNSRGRGRYEDNTPPPPPAYAGRSSRSRSHGRRGEDERRRGGHGWYRHYSEDDEIEDLERRLNGLRKELSKRGKNYKLDDEIEYVKARLEKLERRRWRYHREDEERRHRRRSVEKPRRRRSRSPESAEPRRRSRSVSSRSAGSDRRRRSPSSRSRSRSPSSESDAGRSRSRSIEGAEKRRRSPSYERARGADDDRRRDRSSVDSRSSSSGSSRSSDYSKRSR